MTGNHSKARQAYRWARKRAKRASSYALLVRYCLLNRLGRRSVLGDMNVTVSLTTYGNRIETVAYTIESIAAGRVRPRRLVLWLDDPRALADLPASLQRLRERGLEISLSANRGPHTKYFPALEETLARREPLVTADDDLFYPVFWLQALLQAAERHPEEVVCYRAGVVALMDDAVAPYARWPRCKSAGASLTHFATGVSGVFYPPAMVHALWSAGEAFMDLSPSADDLWLHRVALRARVPIRQVSTRARHFPYIPGSQNEALVAQNVNNGGNDAAIRRLYTQNDITTLRENGSPELGAEASRQGA